MTTIKCNVDAIYNAGSRIAAAGMVIRNHEGQFVAGRHVPMGVVQSVFVRHYLGRRIKQEIWI